MFVNCPVGLIYLHIPSKDPISGGERQEETYCVFFHVRDFVCVPLLIAVWPSSWSPGPASVSLCG